MSRMTKRKAAPGDVCELSLGDGHYAYGRVLRDASIAVYRSVSQRPNAPPIGEREFLFTVGVYDDVPGSAAAPIVGRNAFSSEEEAWPPPYKIVDPNFDTGSDLPPSRDTGSEGSVRSLKAGEGGRLGSPPHRRTDTGHIAAVIWSRVETRP